MVIFELQVEGIEEGSWLFVTESLAKEAAETKVRNDFRDELGEAAEIFQFYWIDNRLYIKDMIPDATAYTVRERVLYGSVEW